MSDFPRGWSQGVTAGINGAIPVVFATLPATPGIVHVADSFDVEWSVFSVAAGWAGGGIQIAAQILDGAANLWTTAIDIVLAAGAGVLPPPGFQFSLPSLSTPIAGTLGNSMTFQLSGGTNGNWSGIVAAVLAGHDI